MHVSSICPLCTAISGIDFGFCVSIIISLLNDGSDLLWTGRISEMNRCSHKIFYKFFESLHRFLGRPSLLVEFVWCPFQNSGRPSVRLHSLHSSYHLLLALMLEIALVCQSVLCSEPFAAPGCSSLLHTTQQGKSSTRCSCLYIGCLPVIQSLDDVNVV